MVRMNLISVVVEIKPNWGNIIYILHKEREKERETELGYHAISCNAYLVVQDGLRVMQSCDRTSEGASEYASVRASEKGIGS